MSDTIALSASFVVYLAVMLAIGLYAWRLTQDHADYLLGGRRLGRVVTALSAGASDMSGWLLLGLPGYAYLSGLEAGWIALGLVAGTWLNWRYVAARLRVATERAGDALTLPAYFANRFPAQARLLRPVAAFFILLFFTFYTSSGLVAGGKLFNAVFGLSYEQALLLGTATIVAYTFLGGFLAVSWTDVVQGLLMVGALVLVPLAALWHWLEAPAAAARTLDPVLLDPFTGRDGTPLGWLAIASLLGWGLGYFGQPHILARFMAIRSPAELPAARRLGMSWVVVSLTGALAVGLLGVLLLDPPLAGAQSETVFIRLAETLLHPLLAGICLAAILAAIMSTADSQLLVAASALSEDLYRAFSHHAAAAPGQRRVWLGRAAVLAVSAVAFALALDPESKVLELVAYAWAGFGAAFGPAVLFSLYWPRMTGAGALAGIVVGGLVVIVWKRIDGGIFDLYEIVPGFVLSALAIVAVSLATGRPPRQPGAR
jgi:sodium/proline symporter